MSSSLPLHCRKEYAKSCDRPNNKKRIIRDKLTGVFAITIFVVVQLFISHQYVADRREINMFDTLSSLPSKILLNTMRDERGQIVHQQRRAWPVGTDDGQQPDGEQVKGEKGQQQERVGVDRHQEQRNQKESNTNGGLKIQANLQQRRQIPVQQEQEKNQEKEPPHGAAFVIAVVPNSVERLIALWSQLECFIGANENVGNENQPKFHTIMISAPDWAKDENILEPYVEKAIEVIPHLKLNNIDIQFHYTLNNRYDIGLWCDALSSTSSSSNRTMLDQQRDVVLINDSIMAIKENFTGVLDLLRSEDLEMTSLNYAKSSNPDNPNDWVESPFRGFSKTGIQKFYNHSCGDCTHRNWVCRWLTGRKLKRCIVEKFEMDLAYQYDARKISGLFPSDVPKHMVVDKKPFFENPLWHSHYGFWNRLREHMDFPAMKVSDTDMLDYIRSKNPEVFNTCTTYLDPSVLKPIKEKLGLQAWRRQSINVCGEACVNTTSDDDLDLFCPNCMWSRWNMKTDCMTRRKNLLSKKGNKGKSEAEVTIMIMNASPQCKRPRCRS